MRRALLLAALAVGACTSESTTDNTCGPQGSGVVVGAPSLEVGRGASSFIPVDDGDTWTAANGPQGGSHLWLALRTTGMGPMLRSEYRYQELDGGTLAVTRGSVTMCARFPVGQEASGIPAFLPDEPDVRQRLLCEGPFDLRVRVSDEEDREQVQTVRVGGVESDPESFIPFRLRCDAGVGDGG